MTEKNQNSIAFHQHMGYAIVANFRKIGFKENQWLDTLLVTKTLVRR
ncbi:N-acetyltransferase family protein [Fructobacillus fructosus]